jgi:RNA 2',3'-cyclic 3'-phosphodiesterase
VVADDEAARDLRLFVAFPVAAAVSARLDGAVAPLRARYDGLGWTRPDGWHVTIAFLGRVPAGRVPDVVDAAGGAVAAVGAAAVLADGRVRLRLGEPGQFGGRVLWVGVEDDPAGLVAEVGGAVQAALVGSGFEVDERPVHPHLTLARARNRGRLPAELVGAVPAVGAGWEVPGAVLYRSVLGRGPARYEVVAELPLVGVGKS